VRDLKSNKTAYSSSKAMVFLGALGELHLLTYE
jgi:hypothetical protein